MQSSTTLVPGGLTVGGWLHSAVSLSNGDVFVAGGQHPPPGPPNGNSTANAQLYNYFSNSFTSAPPLLQPRAAFPMVLFPSGQLLIPGLNVQGGGSSVTILKDVELRIP